MASPNSPQQAQPNPNPARRRQDAAHVLGRVFGEEVFAALHDGFLRGDLTGVVPLLSATTSKPYLRQAAQAGFVEACVENEAGAAALLLEGDGVDGDAGIDGTGLCARRRRGRREQRGRRHRPDARGAGRPGWRGARAGGERQGRR